MSGMLLSFLVAITTFGNESNSVEETVDLIELNHYHDCLGRHVYDQVVFYEWSPAKREYHVRAWCLMEDQKPMARLPIINYVSKRTEVRWHDRDQTLNRVIRSRHFRESWTQVDPERANKSLREERDRTALVKRRLDPSTLPGETIESAELAECHESQAVCTKCEEY